MALCALGGGGQASGPLEAGQCLCVGGWGGPTRPFLGTRVCGFREEGRFILRTVANVHLSP